MRLSIIVPCYNECDRLLLCEFDRFLKSYPEVNICFVNDGSKDGTQILLETFAIEHPENIYIVQLEKNQGKGEAVRRGMCYMLENHQTDYLCYIDADLSTPLSEVARLAIIIKNCPELFLVFGSRVSVFGSQINRLNYRHYGGRMIATLIDIVLKLSIYDTQCGLKIFKSNLANAVFKDPFFTRWLFDVEIFARMKLLYTSKKLNHIMKEIPVYEWTEKGDSKIRFKDIAAVPFALLNIRAKYAKQNYELQDNTIHEIVPLFTQAEKF